MAQLTISDAARATGVSRVTLHRYIKAGKLSRTPDGLIDTAELLRIGLVLQPDTLQQPVTVQRPATSPATPPVPADTPTLERLIEVLQRELDDARAREQAAREREAMLLQMLQQVQQQNQRLLEAPRSVPAPSAPAPLVRSPDDPAHPSRVVSPVSEPFPTRGAARQRILALLREYPEGLTATELRVLLRAGKSLSDTCGGMFKQGLLRKVGRGRYVVA
jgi:DNA-binding transcriptional MerR regulator